MIGSEARPGPIRRTPRGFAAALEQGAQILESDVHVSRDGVPVLLDPDVGRVSDGDGLAADLDFAALALDAGAYPSTEAGGIAFFLKAAFEAF